MGHKDHRAIGSELNLFHFDETSPGMAYWEPAGFYLYNQIESYLRRQLTVNGHLEIKTPLMAGAQLWKKSGHIPKFKDHMFFSESEKREYALKPMNCPLHIQMFKKASLSYNDLPIRYVEFGHCHRNEQSGSLSGLLRVRSFTQDDGHVFCELDSIKDEVQLFVNMLFEVYGKFGFSKDRIQISISTRPENRVGEDSVWDEAEKQLMDALSELSIPFDILEGEGAFYGPKIEFALLDSIERVWQCGTIQLDFNLSERLNAKYINSEGKKVHPVILHRAILGSMERFIAIILEEYQGKLPYWLNPNAISILPISEKQRDFASDVNKELLLVHGLNNVIFDDSDNTLGYKIKNHHKRHGNYMLIIGDDEVSKNGITVQSKDMKKFMSVDEFVKNILNK